ncbi:MAG: hypothetical protein ABI870_04345 [Rhodanobacter sp.]
MVTTEIAFTIFLYLYRDAANFSVLGTLLLRGACTARMEHFIRANCDSHEYFVAEQVRVPTLYAGPYKLSNGPTIDDVAFHEFLGLRPATSDDVASLKCSGKLYDLAGKFCGVRRWDCALSPHCW